MFPNKQKLCVEWLQSYTLSTAVSSSTAFLIEIINEVLTAIIVCKCLMCIIEIGSSKFQRFVSITFEKVSTVPKLFLFEWINTVLLLILVNSKIPELDLPDGFPIFNGKFVDFDSSWYRAVGTTITLTMVVNIIVPLLTERIFDAIRFCRRCKDRGCTRDYRKTKTVIQEEYDEMYMEEDFEIEVRYAQVVSSFTITMMFSSGMPLLYPIFLV